MSSRSNVGAGAGDRTSSANVRLSSDSPIDAIAGAVANATRDSLGSSPSPSQSNAFLSSSTPLTRTNISTVFQRTMAMNPRKKQMFSPPTMFESVSSRRKRKKTDGGSKIVCYNRDIILLPK